MDKERLYELNIHTLHEPPLRSCPFCLSEEVYLTDNIDPEDTFHKLPSCYWVTCSSCGARGPVKEDEKSALIEWGISEFRMRINSCLENLDDIGETAEALREWWDNIGKQYKEKA